jgi:predicted permease
MPWITRLFRRDRLDRELDKELRFHVETEVDRLVAAGVAPDEARRRAMADFGGLEPMKETARDARGTRWVSDLAHDVRFTGRLMRRSPAFTVAAALSLAIGIGANAAIFTVIDALLLRPLDVPHPEQLYFLNRAGYGDPNFRFSYPRLTRLQHAVTDVHFAGAGSTSRVQLTRDGQASLAIGQLVTGSWFDVLGVSPAAGRLISDTDVQAPGTAAVVVLSYDFWQREFGGSRDAVGRILVVNGVSMTIVGVTPEEFRGISVGDRIDLWAPVTMQANLRLFGNASIDNADGTKPWVTQDGVQWLTITARVPADVPPASASSRVASFEHQEITDAAGQIADTRRRAYRLREHVEMLPGYRGVSDLRSGFAMPLNVLMATVAVVLLIACANLASLLMARSAARGREFALRLSLGAGRGRLVRQLLTESFVLAALGGALGLALARIGSRALLSLVGGGRPVPLATPIDWRLLVFTGGVTLATGVLFGLGPALRASRASVGDRLKSGSRIAGVEGGHRVTFGRTLIVLQVALSLTLLVGAILFARTLQQLLTADSGFDRTRVLVATFDPRMAAIGPAEWPALYTRLLESARAIPGAQSASLALSGPVSGSARTSGVQVDDQPMPPGDESIAREDYVGPDYATTVGMTLLAGRTFDDHDTVSAPKVAIVNESFVRHFLKVGNPIGHRLGYGPPADVDIVGVIRDARIDGPRSPVPPLVLYPLVQHADEVGRSLYVRFNTSVSTAAATPALRAAIASADRRLAVGAVLTLEEQNARTVSTNRIVSQLTAAFGLLAVLVACVGLYGTMSYSVARRTNEIGVRMAMGATPGGVRWMVLREVLALVVVGAMVGVAASWMATRYISALLYGLSPHDPAALVAATIGLAVIGLLAGALPAWRASRVDPLVALRTE